MNCPLHSEESAGILLDYTARRLDEVGTAMLERHMASCAQCAVFRDQQAAVWNALDAWEATPVSTDFNRTLWARIDAAEAAPWYVRLGHLLQLGSWKPVAPLAVAALVIATGFLMDHPSGGSHTTIPGQTAAVSVAEADQVEQTLDDIQLLYQFESTDPGTPPRRM
jgi:hypothetical protein